MGDKDIIVFDSRSGSGPLPDRMPRQEVEYDGRRIVVLRI